MPIFRRDPEKHLNDIHDKMVAKSGLSFASTLKNELAAAKTTTPVFPSTQAKYTAKGVSWISEEAMGLESSRPRGRDRRSVDEDRRGWAPGGIFGARNPDVDGRVPYERWPSETRGGGGCSCGHPKCMN